MYPKVRSIEGGADVEMDEDALMAELNNMDPSTKKHNKSPEERYAELEIEK